MIGIATKKRVLLQLAMLIVATGFYSVTQAQVDNITVQLALDANQTKLLATTVGSCQKANHKGCVNVKKDRKARIHYVLKGNTNCNKPGGKKWKLGDVYLGGKNSANKPGVWGNLDQEVRADFNVADAASGRLNGEAGSNDQQIIISDQNKYKYDIWYKVTANCVDSDGKVKATIETDPRIENDGTTAP